MENGWNNYKAILLICHQAYKYFMFADLTEYQFKTEPLKHQYGTLLETAHLPTFAILWEMGCGKSKLIIDNISLCFLQNKIDGALIVAPNGVDLNWVIDELPKHMPDKVYHKARVFRYSTKKAKTKKHQEEVKWCRQYYNGIAIMLMSYDAFMTLDGKEAALKFMEARKCFYVLDESVAIKTPSAKRTMRICRTGWRAKYRRIMDGYPAPNGAFDLYSQFKFLDDGFWKPHYWDSFSMFKSYFGVFKSAHNYGTGTDYEVLLGYQNLEELNKIIAPHSSRLLKDDVLDLPPKVYLPRYFDLSPQQREYYDKLKEEFKLWLDSDTLITANLAVVRMLRLQQISCGYIPVSEEEPVRIIEGKNPRLDLLEELLENRPEQKIIWATYKLDHQLIGELLTKKYPKRKFVTYTGSTSDDDRIRAKEAFQKGDAEIFLATQAAAGIGLTLHAAHYAIYYSNNFNLRLRKQSEDRSHRQGLKHTANYIDLLGNGTIDKLIMLNLCGKMTTSDIILGDTAQNDIRGVLKNWFKESVSD